MNMSSIKVFAVSTVFLLSASCTTIDLDQVQARAGSPAAAHVDEVEIPFDDTLPVYVLALEKISVSSPVRRSMSKYHTDTAREVKSSGSRTWKNDSTSSENRRGREDARVQGWEREGNKAGSAALPKGNSPSRTGSASARKNGVWNVSDTDEEKPSADTIRVGDADVKGTRIASSGVGRQSASTSRGSSSRRTTEKTHALTTINKSSWTSGLGRRQRQIVAQFTSALSGVSNFSIVSSSAVSSLGSGKYSTELRDGEIGPFIVRAQITEYESRVEDSSSKTNVLIVDRKSKLRKGVVGLDVSIFDGRTARLVRSFTVNGTFAKQEKEFGALIGVHRDKAMAQSVMDQALRVALNEAAEKAFVAMQKIRG